MGVDLQAERREHAQEALEAWHRMAPRRGPRAARQGLAEGDRQWACRTSLHLGDDPSGRLDPAHQLVQQNGLPDAAQTVQDPAAVALAFGLDPSADDVERVENVLAACQERWPTPSAGLVGIRNPIHDHNR